MKDHEVKNNKTEVPLAHYRELFRNMDPEERARELTVPFEKNESGGGTFTITMYHYEYRVSWPDAQVVSEDPDAPAVQEGEEQIMLLRLLLNAVAVPGTGKYKTFPELPGAAIYTKTFNGRCLARAAYKFGTNLAGFRKGAETLGGAPAGRGDAGYTFALTGEYYVMLLVYEGDDEFPPNAQFLYSDNFATLTAEDAVVAAEILITALGRLM